MPEHHVRLLHHYEAVIVASLLALSVAALQVAVAALLDVLYHASKRSKNVIRQGQSSINKTMSDLTSYQCPLSRTGQGI